MKAEVPAPVRITRIAARSSSGRRKRSSACLRRNQRRVGLAQHRRLLRDLAGRPERAARLQSPSSRPSLAMVRLFRGRWPPHDSRRAPPIHAPSPARPGRRRSAPSLTAAWATGRYWLIKRAAAGSAGQIPEHRSCARAISRVRPVVADAVAQAVLQVVVESRAARVIVLGPMPRLGLHARDRPHCGSRTTTRARSIRARSRPAPRAPRAARRSRPGPTFRIAKWSRTSAASAAGVW